jgi:tetratricopeptide (TPR) repeat protein
MKNNKPMRSLIWLVTFALGVSALAAGAARHGGGHRGSGHGGGGVHHGAIGGGGGRHFVSGAGRPSVSNVMQGNGPFTASPSFTPMSPRPPAFAPGFAQPMSRSSTGFAPNFAGARSVTQFSQPMSRTSAGPTSGFGGPRALAPFAQPKSRISAGPAPEFAGPKAVSPAGPAAMGISRTPLTAPPAGYPGAGLSRGFAYRPAGVSPAVSGVGNFNAGRPFYSGGWTSAMHGGWNNSYAGYHSGWIRGYWPRSAFAGGNASSTAASGGAGWGFGSGLGLGLGSGLGYGLSSWLFGPALSSWGYSSYSNPYYNGGYGAGYGAGSSLLTGQPVGYDYSQPINSMSQPVSESTVAEAEAVFDHGRDAFKSGDYAQALALCDQALLVLPDDPALHEFRAVTLFALKRYDEAAATLYAVLSAGPGWDWPTLIGLYGNPESFTQHLRELELYCTEQPDSAAGRFVLAYLYLTEGQNDAALRQFQRVAALQPKDRVSAQLAAQLGPPQQSAAGTDFVQTSAPVPVTTLPGTEEPTASPGALDGTWTAQPNDDTSITVAFGDRGRFVWTVTRHGKEEQFEGSSSCAGGILTLTRDQSSEALVGKLQWQDENRFAFKALGSGPDDSGLSFTRTP